ncbi:gp53-like domain-containing protein [Caballeronia zhejiangensis]|uniref:gp53-like domain-containing protein n=1 Tax=Caballeronia zhejiangensis TaxID=871203 RepID=UPI001588DE34|nr:glycosyl hydrolase family 28-related protein [Caballeronia zhejiangensis]
MTISSQGRKAGPFPGNGATTVFPFTFKVFDKTDLKVLRVDASGTSTTLTLDSDYSVTLNADQNGSPGGSITYPVIGSPLPSGYSLVGLGDLPYDQETDITNLGGFYPEVIEDMVDKSTIQIQQLAENVSRAIVFNEAESTSPVLPTALGRANTVLGFDSSGALELLPLPSSLGAGDLQMLVYAAGTDFTPGATTQIVLPRAPISRGNVWVYWDGTPQLDFTVSGNTLIFPTAIPTGISNVYVRLGTTLSVGAPAQQSVTDASVAPGSKLWNRVNGAIADVRDFGALGYPYDDSAAFLAAVATGRKVYVPSGVWQIKQTVTINNGHLFGDGQNSTVIRWIGTGVNDTIFKLGALSSISDVFISFANPDGSSIVTGNETTAQRIAIDVGAAMYPLQRGGCIRRVKIGECGTAIYNKAGSSPVQAVFSAEFADIECQNFSYAGFWFGSPVRTGNVYRNIYLNSAKWPQVQYAFYLGGQESEITVDQLNIESMTCVSPVTFSGCSGVSVGTIHFEEVILAVNSAGLISWDKSAGRIDVLTVYYCDIKTTDWSIVKFNSSSVAETGYDSLTANYLNIGVFHLVGLNQGLQGSPTGLTGLSGVYFIERPVTPGAMYCQIDNYTWSTFASDQAVYQAFPCDPQANISFIQTAAGPQNVGSSIPTSGFSAWWLRRHDGLMEEGGPFTVPANSTITVTFPNPYTNQALHIDVNAIDASTTANYSVRAIPVNNSTFQIVNASSNSISGRWHSIGK